jgi:hypothetical protein
LAWAQDLSPEPEWLRVKPDVTAAKFDLVSEV